MEELKVKFQVAGALVIDCPPGELIGLPREAFVDLYLVQGKKREKIKQIQQLKGKVKITSPEAALDFVRLRTGRDTWYLIGGKGATWAEVTSVPNKGSRSWDNEGFFGFCLESTFQKLGLQKTSAVARAGAYVIHRNIIQHSRSEIRDVYVVTERVTTDGGYIVESSKSIRTPVKFYFPRFL